MYSTSKFFRFSEYNRIFQNPKRRSCQLIKLSDQQKHVDQVISVFNQTFCFLEPRGFIIILPLCPRRSPHLGLPETTNCEYSNRTSVTHYNSTWEALIADLSPPFQSSWAVFGRWVTILELIAPFRTQVVVFGARSEITYFGTWS